MENNLSTAQLDLNNIKQPEILPPVNVPINQQPVLPNLSENTVTQTSFYSFGNIFNLLKNNKYYVIGILVLLAFIVYYLYTNNKLPFLKKKENVNKPETESVNVVEQEQKNVLNIDNEYHVVDEHNNSVKINLKELIKVYNQSMHHQLQQQIQNQLKPLNVSQMMPTQTFTMQQPMQQPIQQPIQQMQPVPPIIQQITSTPKLSHPGDDVEENDDDELNNREIEDLKRQLAELEKENYNVVASNYE
jgi:hypothetical protein